MLLCRNTCSAFWVASLSAALLQAAPIASESFDYPLGTELTGGRANGGIGWAGGWESTDGKEIRMDGGQHSLWFGNAPGFNQDGTGHIRCGNSQFAIRDWSTPVDLQTSDLYFAALIRVSGTDARCRVEFYDGAGASGNMRMNVGLNDTDGDGNVDLFVDASVGSYPAGAATNTPWIYQDTTYLLVAKRDRHGVSASLIPGDATAPTEPIVWDVSQSGTSGVDLQSMKLTISTETVRFDELSIATTFAEAVAGLQTTVETGLLLTHPADGSTVYQTIPYFEWTDVVAHPYSGTYQIQIDDDPGFADPFDEDIIPALLSWYSPTVEFERGSTYHWRVRYADGTGSADPWSFAQSFTIGFPHVIDVLPTDGWDEIQAKYVQAADYGSTHAQAAELRFPLNHTFNLVQDPADDYLFDYPDKGNFIINGQGSALILQCTQTNELPKCGFMRLASQPDVQINDIVIDYHPNSLAQFGGVISNLDKVNGSFTVTVDTDVYANFHEAAGVDQGTFMYAENQARVQDIVRYYMAETWAQAQQSDTVFNFTFDPAPDADLMAELNNGDYFISSPIPDRGGQVFQLPHNSANSFLAHNVTTKASRGILIAGTPYHTRFLNCSFLRTQGRLRGSSSGGVNQQGDYAWFENNRFEYTRDDSYHNGGAGAESDSPGQMVFRNSEVIGGYRASIWAQMDRTWVADNIVRHAGGNAIFIGRSGVNNTENDQMDVGLFENNVVLGVRGVGVVSGVNGSAAPDPVTGMHNQYLTIRNNTVFDTTKNQAFELDYLKNSTVESNRVCNTIDDWSAYSTPSIQIGFHFDNSENITGSGNRVYDDRLDVADQFVVEASSSSITVEVLDSVAVQEAPLFIVDPFAQRPGTKGLSYAASLADNAIDYNGDPLSFTNVFGPNWLNTASDGTITGTPDTAGLESWVVQVFDDHGGMDTATLVIPVSDTESIIPSGDSYVQGDDFADSNFGASTESYCKTDSANERFTREPYLKFDLSGSSSNVAKAVLRLKVASVNGSGDTHAVHFVPDDSWAESTLTWSNKPTVGVILDSATHPAVGEWIEFDLTEQVNTELAGDGTLSLAVLSAGTVYVGYYSLEAVEADRPQLVLLEINATGRSMDGLAGYGAWSSENTLANGPLGHDDGDALNNLTEYAFGGDPSDALDYGYPIQFNVASGEAIYTHPQRSASDIRYIVESTTNLVSNIWDEVEASETNANAFATGFDASTYRISTEGISQQFIRLRITSDF